MTSPASRPRVGPAGSPGRLIQHWRKARNLSQFALALEAGISPRHLSFVETGRAAPSREMVLLLATTLQVPLRERNALLLAAGFAPIYQQSELDAPEIAAVRRALDAILRQQEPYPAVVMSRHWDIVDTNQAATRFFRFLAGDRELPGPPNVVRLMFSEAGFRSVVTNWEEVAAALIQRVHREAVGGLPDEATSRLIEEVMGYPGVPPRLRDAGAGLLPVVPVRFERDGRRFNFFSTITTLGTPQDITLQELRIESFFPADPETERAARELTE